MKFTFLVLLLIGYTTFAYTQSTTANMTGEYYLQGVMETASGFQLKADSTFEFFFSYGALDRFGQGHWTVKGDKLVLNSRPRPAKDFALKTSKKLAGQNGIIVKMVDVPQQVLQFVEVGVGLEIIEMDSRGEVVITNKTIDSISLLLRLCPDRSSVFPITDKTLNYFEFSFEPWIAEVFFDQTPFKIVDNKKITGKHPLLTGQSYDFMKGD